MEHIDGNPREALVDSADPSVVSNELKAPTILDRWLGITGGREQRSEQIAFAENGVCDSEDDKAAGDDDFRSGHRSSFHTLPYGEA